jgi:plastocyanin
MQRRILSLIVLALLALGLAACSSSSKSSSSSGGTAQITIKDFSFTVQSVPAGSTVTVKNDGPSTHTVTADNGEFNTDNISSGDTKTFTAPSKPGNYAFHCNIHPTTMKATLKVT